MDDLAPSNAKPLDKATLQVSWRCLKKFFFHHFSFILLTSRILGE
jgi:hypothetical protein